MALDSNGIKFLLYAKKRGVDLGSTATIGRQFTLATPAEIKEQLERAGENPVGIETIARLIEGEQGYSEGILRMLGADTVESFDASSFEGATHIHDFNLPIADSFKAKYSTVLDGGTLEHVFNYPVALQNCMELIREGGHFLAITPTNNFSGHGFYQFSPELFFRVFSDANGFEIVDMVLMEDRRGSDWHRILDPARLHRRVIFENSIPALLLIIARRTCVKSIFTSPTQQSDYASAWKDSEASGFSERPGLIRRLPGASIRRLKHVMNPRAAVLDTDCFVRFDPFAETTSSKRTL